MLCEKCVILCFVVVYAVHCFGIIVKKIVGCPSNFVMMMLYYIDMCVCLFVCLFQVMLLFSFYMILQVKSHDINISMICIFECILILIYIYIMFCWVELFEFHCVQSISYLYYIFDMYFCVIRSLKPHRNCKKPTYDNKHKQEPT